MRIKAKEDTVDTEVKKPTKSNVITPSFDPSKTIASKYLDVKALKANKINPAPILLDLLSPYLAAPSIFSGLFSSKKSDNKRPLGELRKAIAETRLAEAKLAKANKNKSSKAAPDKKDHKEKAPAKTSIEKPAGKPIGKPIEKSAKNSCPLSIETILEHLNKINPNILDTDPHLRNILNGFFSVYPKYIEAVPNLRSKLKPDNIYECSYTNLIANVFNQINQANADQIIVKNERMPANSIVYKWLLQHPEDREGVRQGVKYPFFKRVGDWGIGTYPYFDKINEIAGLKALQMQLPFLPEDYHVETYHLLLNRLSDPDPRVKYIACEVAKLLLPQLKINSEQHEKIITALLNCIESDDVMLYCLGFSASEALALLPVPIKQRTLQDRILKVLYLSLPFDSYNVSPLRKCLDKMIGYLDEKQITGHCCIHLDFVLEKIRLKPEEHLFLMTFYYRDVFRTLLPNSSPILLAEYWRKFRDLLQELMEKSNLFTATNREDRAALENIISQQTFILQLLANFAAKVDVSTQKNIIDFILSTFNNSKSEDNKVQQYCLEALASLFPKKRDKESKDIDAKEKEALNLNPLIDVLIEKFKIQEDEYLSLHQRLMKIFIGIATQLNPMTYKERVYPVLLDYLKQIIERRGKAQGFAMAVINRALFYYLFSFEKILSSIDHAALSTKDEQDIYELLKPDLNEYLKLEPYNITIQNGEFALLTRLFTYIEKIEIQNNMLRVLCHNLIEHRNTKTLVPQDEEDDCFAMAEHILKTLITNNLTPDQCRLVFTEINQLLLTSKIKIDAVTILPVLSIQSTLIQSLAKHSQEAVLSEAFEKFNLSSFNFASYRMMLMLIQHLQNPSFAIQIVFNKLVELMSSGFDDRAKGAAASFIPDEFFINHPKEISELFAPFHNSEYYPEKIALITLFKKCLEVPNAYQEFAMIGLNFLLSPPNRAMKDFTTDPVQHALEEHLPATMSGIVMSYL